jgi:DNA helicase-2/ATP-dependent DNA helicase PcrA
MCVKILRSHIDFIGFDRNFTIYDDGDRDKVIKRVIDDLGYEQDVMFKLAKNCISTAKNDCIYPKHFAKAYPELRFCEELENVYRLYNLELENNNALDFDDLLFKTYELFVSNPEIADYYSDKFKYIHVDEFQDTNKVQFAIIQRLSLKHGNIFVVGDDDQSIYG